MTTTWDASTFDAFERRGWTGLDAAYADGFARMTAHTVAPLLDAAGVGAGSRVLDVGTGPGTVAAAALARGARVTAVDASPGMAARAAAACPGAEVLTAVLPELPLPDAAFDAVVGNFVINHLGDPEAGLAELRRVLRPGGRLALTCWESSDMRATAVFGESVEAAGVPVPEDLPARGPFLAGFADRAPAFAELLDRAGLVDTGARRVKWTHRVDPDAWWASVVGGTPITGSLVARLAPADAARIKRHYDLAVAHYAEPGSTTVALPAVAVLAAGTRPNT
ncbi:class I SAM-dependent methyltransferase [Streptacidiphilus albus]|uniref:class I SAM-dependent methyltransferase n=1 Tax=Streptacidiphilus albus TaxID=105425 RepID=UPI00054C5B3D|nr:class I SAM-dependent methyltransferase [Streptacidiphilus albus]